MALDIGSLTADVMRVKKLILIKPGLMLYWSTTWATRIKHRARNPARSSQWQCAHGADPYPRLQDIGKKSNGTTVGEAISQILGPVIQQVGTSVASLSLNTVGKTIQKGVEATIKTIKGLLQIAELRINSIGSHYPSSSFCSLEKHRPFSVHSPELLALYQKERLPYHGFTILQRGFRWDF